MMMKRAIILINTGSPESLALSDVRAFLEAFLTDKRIINLPSVLRILLVKGIIVPRRAPKTRDKYALIWEEEGAPLVLRSVELVREVQRISGVPTFTAMRYQKGSLKRTLDKAAQRGCEEVVLVPLFPHYARSSYESAIAHAMEVWQQGAYTFALRSVAPYYHHPIYIEALAEQVSQSVPMASHLVFSYHGIPLAQAKPYLGNIEKDYERQCQETTRLLMAHPWVKSLQLTHEVAYQSRFGSTKWLSPTLEERLAHLPSEGHKKVAVVCPSFVCDGLETTWEIGMHLKAMWAGDQFTLVPCPNASHTMARAIVDLINHSTTDVERWIAP